MLLQVNICWTIIYCRPMKRRVSLGPADGRDKQQSSHPASSPWMQLYKLLPLFFLTSFLQLPKTRDVQCEITTQRASFAISSHRVSTHELESRRVSLDIGSRSLLRHKLLRILRDEPSAHILPFGARLLCTTLAHSPNLRRHSKRKGV